MRHRHGHHGHPADDIRLDDDRDRGRRFSRHDGAHRQGRHRRFDGGELRLVLLALLEQQPSHGYELIKAIEDRAGTAYSPSPGVIYPTLTLLEELGHATVESMPGGRKRYALTETGLAYLAEHRDAANAVLARMTAAADGPRPPQLVRAVENLKTALRLRLSRGTPSAAEIEAIAAALDAAALSVERA